MWDGCAIWAADIEKKNTKFAYSVLINNCRDLLTSWVFTVFCSAFFRKINQGSIFRFQTSLNMFKQQQFHRNDSLWQLEATNFLKNTCCPKKREKKPSPGDFQLVCSVLVVSGIFLKLLAEIHFFIENEEVYYCKKWSPCNQ